MKNIWIINQYASHLDYRHFMLSKEFASKGYNVTVITSSFHHGKREYVYPDTMTVLERAERVKYIYLRSKPEYTNSGVKRVFNMFGFNLLFMQKLKDITAVGGEPSFIIASSAPPTVWEIGYRCAKKFGAKFVVEFRDIWPMSLVEIQGVSPRHPIVTYFGILEKRAYRRADSIVSVIPFADKYVCDELGYPREKLHWMPNGINAEEVDRILERGEELPEDLDKFLSENWCSVYVGSIAKCECVDFMAETFELLKDKDACFAIVGEGGETEYIKELVEKQGLDNVKVFPAVKKEQVPAILDKAKCCLAAAASTPLYEYGISPNKLGDYLYSGKPTVYACDVHCAVNDAGHITTKFGDKKAFAEAILNIKSMDEASLAQMSERAKALILKEYDYRSIGERYLTMMESL